MPTAMITQQEKLSTVPQPNTRLEGRALWLVRAAWLAIFLLIAGMVMVNIPHLLNDTRSEWQVGQALYAGRTIFPSIMAFVRYVVFLKLIAAAVFVGTAVFLAWRGSDDWMVLFTSATLLLLVYLFGFGLNVDIIRYPAFLEDSLPIIRMLVPTLMMGSLIGLFFLFPDGRFYPRWMAVVAVFAFLLTASVSLEAFYPSFELDLPFLSFLPREWGWLIFVYSLLTALLIGLISRIAFYYKQANETQRQQIKLVLFGLGVILAVPMLQGAIDALNVLSNSWQHFLFLHTGLLLPIILPLTIGMSVLRYRLWEVDLLISRTLVYGVLTAGVLLLYGLVVGLAGVLLPSAVDSLLPILGLALVIVVARPLRDQLQRWADRLLPMASAAPPTKETPVAISSWPMRIMQGLWLFLLLLLVWQVGQRLLDFDGLLLRMRQEWIISEVSRGLSSIPVADLVRFIVFSELWNLVISWSLAIFVFWRRRRVWMGLLAAYLLLIMPFGVSFGTYGQPISEGFAFIGIGLGTVFLFVFPDGRFVPRSWLVRGLLVGALIAILPATLGLAQFLQPDVSIDEQVYFSFIFTITVLMVSGIGSQSYRYRKLSDDMQKRQSRWVLLGLSARVAWFIFTVIWIGLDPSLTNDSRSLIALITIIFSLAASIALPLSIAVAIVYDRLWQMDLVLNRTLVFGGLTALVVILYVIVVGVLGALFQSGNNLLLSVVATGLIAILFNPLRQRLQRGVNRLIYGRRDDPLALIADLGQRLENTAVPGETLAVLVQTIAQTLKLPYVAIVGNDDATIAASGEGTGRDLFLQNFPLIYQTQTIGQLQVAPRAAGEQFTPDEESLLRHVAQQAGSAVFAYKLTDQLQRSRERLVTAREEERRRLRRDLHDGLGPQLATLTVKVSAAENLLEQDPTAAKKLLAEVRSESQSAIQEIRRVVEDLRPANLDQLGLLSALELFVAQYSGSGIQITLDAPQRLPMLPAAVEVAAYRIVTEAVTNTIRHANAQSCKVKIAPNGEFLIIIIDDGDGFSPPAQHGVGLNSMNERAVELGGIFEVQSTPGVGTTITVKLPYEG